MAIQDTNGDTRATDAGFCIDCGAQLLGGRFCANCGHPVDQAVPFPRHEAATQRAAGVAHGGGDGYQAPYEQPTEPLPPNGNGYHRSAYETPPYAEAPPAAPYYDGGGAAVPPAAGQQAGGKRRWPVVVAILAFVAALAAAGAAIYLTSTSSSDSGSQKASAYEQQVTETLTPVNEANARLSDSLGALRRGRPTEQIQAVGAARDATSSARGALGAMEVPDGSAQLAQQARQALDREQTYLKVVSVALARPTDPGLSQLQTLAGNLTSALEAVDAPIPGAARNVSGVDSLTTWALRERRAARRRKLARTAAGTAPATGGASTTPAPTPGPTNNDCGDGIYTNSTTTCPFATNVKEGWLEADGMTNTFSAFSPGTGRDITMSCAPSNGGISCSGGTNARVFFDWG